MKTLGANIEVEDSVVATMRLKKILLVRLRLPQQLDLMIMRRQYLY